MIEQVVYFAHGRESGPWGAKIQALAKVATTMGRKVESPDYSDLPDTDARVKRLLSNCTATGANLVLVGSSMGGQVAAVAAESLKPAGMFLLAPAFGLAHYSVREPPPKADLTVIVHGWQDEIVPVENAINYARRHRAELYLVDGDHRLMEQIPFLTEIFRIFLDRVRGT
jgi:pimeloyl-ACP methyl ester carboxylesterase